LRRLGVLVSGRGSNLGAILDAISAGQVDAEVAVVGSNRECPALDLARRRGVPTVLVFTLADHGDSATRDAAMAAALRAAGVDLVVCAGYNRVLDDALVEAFPGRILNVHPSLLPEFGGTMEAVRLAFEAGVKETGVTIHLIEPGTVDAGTILAQERVPRLPGDRLEDLAARVHAAEHRLLPATIQAVLQARLVGPA
jgi:phosphoribosylglycinamide formyltransferase-1